MGRTGFLKIRGHKEGTFTRDERYTLPFLYQSVDQTPSQVVENMQADCVLLYSPPSIVNELDLPGPLCPRPFASLTSGKTDLPFDPPRAPTAQEGWITMVVEKDYREKMFGKKNRVIVKVRRFISISLLVPARD